MKNEKAFCPVCGSAEMIYAVFGTTAQIYECKRCAYRGPIMIVNGKLAEVLDKKYKES